MDRLARLPDGCLFCSNPKGIGAVEFLAVGIRLNSSV